jgi:excisionase family DNA binding protein
VSQEKIGLAQLALGRTALDTLLSVEEAARKLGGLSKYTIHAWLSSGKLRRTKVGSRTMIRESELQRVIQDGGKSGVARSQVRERP